eukprot:TRINITY_DN72588_c0_g1_i1.p1 TRINITY_DN72588_c0_g1~~TRINITY_DN72588_c0_g1_i1.p1  ORF type:complete len:846 (-),score=101.57 TRINITY_DN72588_c0_g1_i1:131-2668(-)
MMEFNGSTGVPKDMENDALPLHNASSAESASRNLGKHCMIVASVCNIVMLVCSMTVLLKHGSEGSGPMLQQTTASVESGTCSVAAASGAPPRVEEVRGNVAAHLFDDLSPQERAAVATAFARATGAALSSSSARQGQDFLSGVGSVQLLLPQKKEALAFLDERGLLPKRYARVTVARPLKGDVMEYRMGPISGTRSKPVIGEDMDALLKDGDVTYAKRAPDLTESSSNTLLQTTLEALKNVLHETFGHTFPQLKPFNSTEGFVLMEPVFPDLDSNRTSRVSMVKFFWQRGEVSEAGSLWLHPLPFVFRMNQTGFNASDWSVYGFYFCGRGPYASAQELQSLYASGRIPPCPYQKPDLKHSSRPGDWDYPGQAKGTKNPRTSQRGPRIVYPDGPRWSVSAVPGGLGRQVEWMGWSFFASIRPVTGLAVWDLRFKGQRVVYELSLQESAALYGGGQGDQTYYLDTAMTGLGETAPALRPGVDCPAGATFFNNSRRSGASTYGQYDIASSTTHQEDAHSETPTAEYESIPSACVFEEDMQKPFWSHVSQSLSRNMVSTGIRGSQLVVRQVANSGNYDYINSVSFGLDGRLRWMTELAGFCETRWFNEKINGWEQEFSPLWHDNLALPVHLHTLSIKVDLDIGTHNVNAVQKLESVAGMPPSSKAAGVLDRFASKYLQSSFVAREGVNESTVLASQPNPQVFKVVNRELQGPSADSPPGYAILLGEAAKNILPEGHPLVDFVSYSKYAMAITERHDNEQSPTSIYDAYAPGQPYMSLDRYLDNKEDLSRTDIVAWVTLAHEHVPRPEDIPLISNYGNMGFSLLPWNIFDGNAANDLPDDSAGECLGRVL